MLQVLLLAPASIHAVRQVVPEFARKVAAEAQSECCCIAGAVWRMDALASTDYAARRLPRSVRVPASCEGRGLAGAYLSPSSAQRLGDRRRPLGVLCGLG